jgi:membrane-bound acyltransferase YfiQ involved in biofilm formation
MKVLPLTQQEKRFADVSVRRKTVFLVLAVTGVVVAAVLAVFYAYQRARDPEYAVGVRIVLVVLILLNARQNLRQFKYARLLEKLLESSA